MEKLLPELYKNFGDYVNRSKMLPNMIDGTIPVWKRILLGAHTISRTEFKKSAQVFGYVIGHWHPHSEDISGTAEILVHNGFLDGKGNWGTRIGIEPVGCAAPRYTSLKINSNLDELAFKYIRDVKWEEDELEPEPVFLPSMFPLCLFAKKEFNMIAFGFKTEIPTYNIKDLSKRLLYLLGERKKVIIAPEIYGCEILSDNAALEDLLSKGQKNYIKIRGKYSVDRLNYRVYIHGWNPRSTFDVVFNGINKYNGWNLFDNGDISFIDESTDAEGTKVRIEVSRQRKKEEVFEKLLEAVEDKLTSTISYNIFAVDSTGKVKQCSVDEFLLSTFNYYTSIVGVHYKRIKKEKEELMEEYKIIEKLKPHISTALKKNTVDEAMNELSKLSGVSVDKIQYIMDKYKIKKLVTVKTDNASLISELKEISTILLDVRKKVTEDYKRV